MAFFKFGKPKSYLGIDIGSYAIKVAEVSSSLPLKLLSFGQVRVPPGGIIGAEEEIVEKLKFLFQNLRIKSKKATVSISSYSSIIKRLEISIPEEKTLDEAIREEAEAHIPFNLNDVYLDYYIISEEDEKIEFIIAAAKKELVDDIFELISGAGINVEAIDIDIIGLVNIFEYIYKLQDSCFLIDLGFTKTSVILVENNYIKNYRDLSVGTNIINQKLQDQLNVGQEEAEKIKLKGQNKKKLVLAIKDYIEEAVKNIMETCKFLDDIENKKIFLSGGGAFYRQIYQKIKKDFNTEVELIKPFVKIDTIKTNKKTKETIEKVGLTAIGLAAREILS